ncbi:uncharacterized protein LOC116660865 [Camelus ferus]|uniref:Uncharacterized protein LOC116660865 n=1 Tax=Camelus ferus TaxID=419612 RepID=A0A8B8SBG9_CAMFR|nr:uncharacterized protein LOC116660865 [Camelus ferus]
MNDAFKGNSKAELPRCVQRRGRANSTSAACLRGKPWALAVSACFLSSRHQIQEDVCLENTQIQGTLLAPFQSSRTWVSLANRRSPFPGGRGDVLDAKPTAAHARPGGVEFPDHSHREKATSAEIPHEEVGSPREVLALLVNVARGLASHVTKEAAEPPTCRSCGTAPPPAGPGELRVPRGAPAGGRGEIPPRWPTDTAAVAGSLLLNHQLFLSLIPTSMKKTRQLRLGPDASVNDLSYQALNRSALKRLCLRLLKRVLSQNDLRSLGTEEPSCVSEPDRWGCAAM